AAVSTDELRRVRVRGPCHEKRDSADRDAVRTRPNDRHGGRTRKTTPLILTPLLRPQLLRMPSPITAVLARTPAAKDPVLAPLELRTTLDTLQLRRNNTRPAQLVLGMLGPPLPRPLIAT